MCAIALSEFVVAYVTASVDLAPILADKLVSSRMAACVNLVPGGASVMSFFGATSTACLLAQSAPRVCACHACGE